MSYTKESVNNLAQSYFREYQMQCQKDPNKMLEELAFWETGKNVIFDMPLERQALYSDYVSKKICEHGSAAAEQLAELSTEHFSIEGYAQEHHVCAVGNYAQLINCMTNPELKAKHLKMHNQMIQYAKLNPSENTQSQSGDCVIF